MPKSDTGIPVVREVGLRSEDALGFEHLASESERMLYERPEPGQSFLERHGGPVYEAEVAATVVRLLQKVEDGQPLHRSERQFLEKHQDV